MKQKLYALLLAAATVGFASAAGVQPMQKLMQNPDNQTNRALTVRHQAKGDYAKMRAARKTPRRMAARQLPGAPDNLQIVTEVPEPDNLKFGVKTGSYYSNSFFFGLDFSNMSTNLSQYEIAGDKFYMNFPFCAMETNGYLVGDVKDNTITITFPQWVNHYEDVDYLGEPYTIDNYALLCEFVPSEDNPEEGWYYPVENQTLTLTISEDGVIENPEWENLMIGSCEWVTEEYDEDTDEMVPVDEPYWDWDGNGDFISSISEVTETAVEMPAGLATEEWTMISGVSGRKVKVGVDGDDMYLQGLFTRADYNPVVKGKIDGNKVSFETGQCLGAYMGNMTLVYFQGATLEYDEEGNITNAELLPAFEFAYDKEKKDLNSTQTAIFSSLPNQILYYALIEKPHIFMPDASLTGKNLLNPVVLEYAPVEDGYSGLFTFNFPNVDADGNILDTSKLYYNVFIDDEVFVIYSDEYPEDLPEGEEMTDIPYDHNGYDIYYYGVEHTFYFLIEGYDSMAIQTIYKDGDFENRSAMVYVVSNSGVKEVANGNEKSVEYYDLQGRRVSGNATGILLRKATLENGSSVTTKVIRR